NHQAIRVRKIQGHLARTTTDVDDSRIAWNRLVEKARKFAPFSPRAKCVKTVTWWIPGEWDRFVEPAYRVGRIFRRRAAGKAQIWNSVRRFKHCATTAACQIRPQLPRTCRTGKHVVKAVHRQKIA